MNRDLKAEAERITRLRDDIVKHLERDDLLLHEPFMALGDAVGSIFVALELDDVSQMIRIFFESMQAGADFAAEKTGKKFEVRFICDESVKQGDVH